MGLSGETMAKLVERHAVERTLLREVTRRYERAAAAAAKAREALDAAEAERVAVLAEWAAAPGWDAERIAAAPPVIRSAIRSRIAVRVSSWPARRAGFAHGDDRQSVLA